MAHFPRDPIPLPTDPGRQWRWNNPVGKLTILTVALFVGWQLFWASYTAITGKKKIRWTFGTGGFHTNLDESPPVDEPLPRSQSVTFRRGADGKFDIAAGSWPSQLDAQPRPRGSHSMSSGSRGQGDRLRDVKDRGRYLAYRRVEICVGAGDEEFLGVWGPLLARELGQVSGIDEVTYRPRGENPPPRSLAPDLTITLSSQGMATTYASGPRRRGKIHGQVTMVIRSQPSLNKPTGPRLFHDPILPFEQSCGSEFDLQFSGISLAEAVMSAARTEARRSAGKVQSLIQDLKRDYAALPTLPTAFYPPYHEAPPPTLTPFGAPVKVASWHGLGFSNRSLWILPQLAGNPDAEEIRKAIVASGWVQVGQKDGGVSFEREGAHLLFSFVTDRSRLPLPACVEAAIKTYKSQLEGRQFHETRRLMYYEQPLNQVEFDQAVAQLLEPTTPLAAALALSGDLNEQQKRRLAERVEQEEPLDAQAWHFAARQRADQGSTEQAKRDLAMLFAAQWVRYEPEFYNSAEHYELARRLKMPYPEPAQAELLRRLRVDELKLDPQGITFVLRHHDRKRLFWEGLQGLVAGGLEISCVRKSDEYPEIYSVQAGPIDDPTRLRSTNFSRFRHPTDIPEGTIVVPLPEDAPQTMYRPVIDARRVGKTDEWSVTVRLEPAPATATSVPTGNKKAP